MTRESLQTYPESQLPPEFRFMSFEQISAFRDQQEDLQYQARIAAMQQGEVFASTEQLRNAADEATRAENHNQCELYVADHFDRETDPQLFTNLTTLVETVSIHNMNHTKWILGEADTDGEYTRPQTSGKAMLEDALETILPAEHDQAGTAESEVEALEKRVSELRNKAAALSIDRRRRTHNKGKKRADLQRRFEEAQAEYKQAYIELGELHVATLRNDESVAEEDIKTLVTMDVIYELGRFTAAERQVFESDTSLRGRFARFLAKSNKHLFAGSFVAGAAVGTGARLAKHSVLSSATVATVGGLAAGGLVAIGALRGSMSAVIKTRGKLISQHEQRAEEDETSLRELLAKDSSQSDASALLHDVISKRVNRDQKLNRREVVGGAIFGALGGLAAYGIADHLLSLSPVQRGESGGAFWMPPSGGPGEQDLPNEISKPHNLHPHANHNTLAGFNPNVTVEAGHGYTQELQDLAAQKDIDLSATESYELYQHLESQFDGKLLTGINSYSLGNGDYGLSNPGQARWNPAVIHEMQHWLEENDKLKKD